MKMIADCVDELHQEHDWDCISEDDEGFVFWCNRCGALGDGEPSRVTVIDRPFGNVTQNVT